LKVSAIRATSGAATLVFDNKVMRVPIDIGQFIGQTGLGSLAGPVVASGWVGAPRLSRYSEPLCTVRRDFTVRLA
jgi:hypothetical protein